MATSESYTLSSESMIHNGVPKGTVHRQIFVNSNVYPDTETEFWIYVPKYYSAKNPACLMVFQDGEAYLNPDGDVRATRVMDNLIHNHAMPVTIGLFINPSTKEHPSDMREHQYVPTNETYSTFIIDEILPLVEVKYNLVSDPDGRAIVGMSDGGLASFTVGWHRSDAFSKVISHIGSYTRLKGGSEYPYLIRQTRGNPKPIRVFLQDGRNDLNIVEGNWTLANLAMESALMFARYDYKFEMGSGGHNLRHGGAIFPETLRWIWRDYPGVKEQVFDTVSLIGEWEMITNIFGLEMKSVLKITDNRGHLSVQIWVDGEGQVRVESMSLDNDILIIEHEVPLSHFAWMEKAEKGIPKTLFAWLKIGEDTLSGALSAGPDSEYDFKIIGRRSVKTRD
jgi:enterochelin esterase family protein